MDAPSHREHGTHLGGCDGGHRLRYVVRWDGIDYSIAATTAYTAGGLTAESRHTVQVRAVTKGGLSSWTNEAAVWAQTPPSAVVGLNVSYSNRTGVGLTWSAPSGGGSVKVYTVFMDDGLGGSVDREVASLGPSATSADIDLGDGVVGGRRYCFAVTADNEGTIGDGGGGVVLVEATMTTSDTVCAYASEGPSSPQNVQLIRSATGEMTVQWSVPADDGGLTILQYEVEVKDHALAYWVVIGTTSSTTLSAVFDSCTMGNLYSFRVRAENLVGWSEYSAVVTGYCAQPPGAPVNLERVNSSKNHVGLGWDSPAETNGASVVSYKVYARSSLGTGAAFVVHEGPAGERYVEHSSGVVMGAEYTYWVTASNEAGEGAESSTITVAVAGPPGPPVNIQVASRSLTNISFVWDAPTDDGGSPITHYELYYGTTSGSVTTRAWLGSGTASGTIYLTAGPLYYFQVTACNVVSLYSSSNCTRSSVVAEYVGTVVPVVPSLELVSTSGDSITVQWSEASDDGGSPVVTYRVYVDDGYGGVVSRLVCDVLGPRLCIADGLSGGNEYRFEMTVVNAIGESPRGSTTVFRACELPPAPVGLSIAQRASGQLTLAWDAPSVVVSACPILGYQILAAASEASFWCDGADYNIVGEIVGDLRTFVYTPGDTGGYCVKVRSTNLQTQQTANTSIVGVPTSIIWARAASVPSAPGPVQWVSGNGTSLVVQWSASSSDGGLPILNYELQRDDGAGGSVWTTVASATTLNSTVAGLTPGLPYGFRVRGVNNVSLTNALDDVVDCCWSPVVYIYAASAPQQPYMLATDSGDRIGDTAVRVRWIYNATIAAMAPSGGLPVTGYKLYRSAVGATVLDVLVYDGTGSTTTELVVTGLTPSGTYRFAATAINAVGESAKEQYVAITCCVPPSRMDRPSVGPPTGNDSAVELNWVAPETTGGMVVMEYRLYRDDGNLGGINTLVYGGGTDLITVVGSGLTIGKYYR